jgi:alcohol dehydrogenase
MSQFQFQTAARIISGLGSIQELKQIILENHYRKLLIITDAGMVQHQLHLPIIEILERLNITYSIYSNIQADPPEHIVLDAAEFAKKKKSMRSWVLVVVVRWMLLKSLPYWHTLNKNRLSRRCMA